MKSFFIEFTRRPFLIGFIGVLSGILVRIEWFYLISFCILLISFIYIKNEKTINKNDVIRLVSIIFFLLFFVISNIFNNRITEQLNSEKKILSKGYVLLEGYAIPTGLKFRINADEYRHKIYCEDKTGKIKPYYKYYSYVVIDKKLEQRFVSGKIYKTQEIGKPKYYNRFRIYLSMKFEEYLGLETGDFLSAILLGMREKIYNKQNIFKEAGLSHLLALSGLHTGIIAAVFYYLFSFFICDIRKKSILVIICIILFLFQTGFSVSVIRASIMIIYYFTGILLYRRSDLLQMIGFTGLLLLLYNPIYLYEPGFQLTMGVTLFIVLYHKYFFDTLVKIMPRWLSGIISVTVLAQIASIPATGYFFNTVNIGGIISNILMVPYFGLILLLGLAYEIMVFLPNIFIKFYSLFYKSLVKLFFMNIRFFTDIPFIGMIDVKDIRKEKWIYLWFTFLVFGIILYMFKDKNFDKNNKKKKILTEEK